MSTKLVRARPNANLFVILLFVISLVIASCGRDEPPSTVTLEVDPATEVEQGEDVAIVARATPVVRLELTWSVSGTAGGTLNTYEGEQVVYRANQPGTDVVVAEGTTASGTPVRQTVTLTVVAGEATEEVALVIETPSPTPTATPSPAPTEAPSPTATVPSALVSISNVEDEATAVAQTVSLVGEYAPSVTDDIWVFVRPLGGRYYPQAIDACGGKITTQQDGRWEVRIGLGGENNVGEFFEIAVTTANARDSQLLADTLQEWCETNNFPGLSEAEMPGDLARHETIAVERGSERYGPRPPIAGITLPGDVLITSVSDGDTVPISLEVTGTASSEVTDSIWALVFSSDGRYYLQSFNACENVHTARVGDNWRVNVSFGGENNSGEPFELVAILADEEANAFFEEKQAEGCATDNFPGLLSVELPTGVEEKDSVQVIRE